MNKELLDIEKVKRYKILAKEKIERVNARIEAAKHRVLMIRLN